MQLPILMRTFVPWISQRFSFWGIRMTQLFRWITNIIQMLYWCGVYEVPVLLSSDSHGYKQVGNVKGSEVLLGAYREVLDFPSI